MGELPKGVGESGRIGGSEWVNYLKEWAKVNELVDQSG